jgi:arsenite/tail-anchored protein-transporting ATPase
VGKTTCAAAHALAAAEAGRRVLLVSTDPAHSLGDALGVRVGASPRAVPTRRGQLRAVALDADRALERWLKTRRPLLATIAERGTYLDAEDIRRFLDLSLPGVDELLGVYELVRLGNSVAPDEVVVDTAPTGHTLRLLQMPHTLAEVAVVLDDMQAKHRFLAESLGRRAYTGDAADRLIAEIAQDAESTQALLRDPDRCGFSWVLLPEALSVAESRDGVAALRRDGVAVRELLVNRVWPPPPCRCRLCDGRRRAEAAVLAELAAAFPGLPIRTIPAQDAEPHGLAALRRFARIGGPLVVRRGRTPGRKLASTARRSRRSREAPPWLETLAPAGRRLLLFGGKGGVGKTSCAATASLALAATGRRVLLLSTDPAHSVEDALEVPLGDDERPVPGAPGLFARELDADRAFAAARERYRRAVDDLFDALRGGSRLDASYDRAVVQDLIDLAPPGIDELFALVAVTDATVARPRDAGYDVVVLDTAPTGHTLRLLALPPSARAWIQAFLAVLLKYREVVGLGRLAEDLVTVSRQLRELEALLRDPERTGFAAVTRAAALPRLETVRLVAALRALHVPLCAVVVNAATPPGCARCRRAAAVERQEVARLRRSLTAAKAPLILAPMVAPPPQGPAALGNWGRTWTEGEWPEA